MTSSSHERDSASSAPGASPLQGADGRSGQFPGGAAVGGQGTAASRTGDHGFGTSDGRTRPTGSAGIPSGSPGVDRTPAGSKGKDRDRDSAKGKPVDGAAGKKPGKAAGSGGDWNVFRTVVVLVGLVIAGFGAYYLILGSAGLPDTDAGSSNPTLESQFRFFSAMMVGVGAAFITIAIKFQWANMLWLVCLMVFVGGIGRVLSWAFSGTPHYIMIILMVVELAFPPALLVWHKYIAKTTEIRKEYEQRG